MWEDGIADIIGLFFMQKEFKTYCLHLHIFMVKKQVAGCVYKEGQILEDSTSE